VNDTQETMSVTDVTTVSIPPEVADTGAALPSDSAIPNFGPNVVIFDPTMSSTAIQTQVDAIFTTQQSNQFGQQRYALFFKPGAYSATVQVGFYTTVHGLGSIPDDVTITGGVNVTATWNTGNATQNFWRGIENLSVVPTVWSNSAMFATSQGTWLRRCHYQGYLQLFDFTASGVNWSSGGFIADTIVDDDVISGSQQQYLTRNTQWRNWYGAVWNMVFVGDTNPPSGTWPSPQFTVVANTPVVREKPYLVIDSSNNYSVVLPALKQNSRGPSWNATTTLGAPPTTIPISRFYVAQAANDSAQTLNIALQRGRHLLLTPGVYNLSQPIVVRNPNTVIFGLGLATLTPTQGTPALIVADVDGVTIAGLLFEAGASNSPNLLQIGDVNVSTVDHSAKPTAIFDISCRVGGAAPTAETNSCVVINCKDVIIDNAWLWRADHGVDPTGWTINPAVNGLIVNADNVTAYGLFVEHFEGFQTVWNGNGGRVYFYQSECPYDVPSQAQWTQNGENGYPSYKVSDSVTSHSGQGIGVYSNFTNAVWVDNAIETPTGTGITMNHMVTVWLDGSTASGINHIINGTGAAATSTSKVQYSSN
jgi:hypothetical protein